MNPYLSVYSIVGLILLQFIPVANAQFSTSFETGFINSTVSWIGDTTRWQVVPYRSDFALRSLGPASPDTLTLFTSSDVQYGKWSITFNYFNGPLSNFNLARIYLWASTPGEHPEQGVYLQLGGNARTIRLYYQENQRSRTLIAESDREFFAADSAQLPLTIARTLDDTWTLTAGSTQFWSFQQQIPLPLSPGFFGLWIKHTTLRGNDFQFDDLVVTSEVEPVDSIAGPAPTYHDIIINEVMYAPDAGGTEFIELYNQTDSTFDLARFTLADNRDVPVELTRNSWLLKPDQFAVVTKDTLALAANFNIMDGRQPPGWPALNNNGDTIYLRYDSILIDGVTFSGDWGTAGHSLERKDPNGPSNLKNNWAASKSPNKGTPGKQNSQFSPDTLGPRALFVERIATDKIELIWNEPIGPAHPLITFQPDNQPPIDNLFKSDTETTLIIEPHWITNTLEISDARDLTGNRTQYQEAEVAHRPLPGELGLNEMLFYPRAHPEDGRADQVEYIEVVNTGNRLISLRHIGITEEPGENDPSDTLFSAVKLASLQPGAFAVFYASRGGEIPGEALMEAFSSIQAPNRITWLPIPGSSLKLDNQADFIQITEGQDRLDAVSYDELWHLPNLASTRGVSLERIRLDVSSSEPTNWSSSRHLEGGTPGYANSIAISNPPKGRDPLPIFEVSEVISPDGDGIDDFLIITYTINGRNGRLRFRIFDASGRLITQLPPVVPLLHGAVVTWDGLSPDGSRLARGLYLVLAEYLDPDQGIRHQSILPFAIAYR